MSTFASAITNALATIRAAAGVTVTYSRGADTVSLTAVPGRTRYESNVPSGVVTEFQTRDYIIKAADLILAGSVTLPQDGDQITDVDAAGDDVVYEAMSPGGDAPSWTFSDTARTHLRIHTKVVEGGR